MISPGACRLLANLVGPFAQLVDLIELAVGERGLTRLREIGDGEQRLIDLV